MPSSALVTQLFSSLMRVYRSFPPVAPYTTDLSEANLIEFESAAQMRFEIVTGSLHQVEKMLSSALFPLLPNTLH